MSLRQYTESAPMWLQSVDTFVVVFACPRKAFQLVQFTNRSYGVLCDGQLIIEYYWPESEFEMATMKWAELRATTGSHPSEYCVACSHSDPQEPVIPLDSLKCWREQHNQAG